MANRKALSSSRQAMNAVQPISTYEGFGTVLFVLVTKRHIRFFEPTASFGTVLFVLVTKQIGTI